MVRQFVAWILVAAMGGCKAVVVDVPLVPETEREVLDVADFAPGVWHFEVDEDDVVVFIDGDSKGKIELATLALFDGAFQKVAGEGQALRLGVRNYVSFRFLRDGGEAPYYLAEFATNVDGDRLMLWPMEETPALRASIEGGELAGDFGAMKSDYGVRLRVSEERLRALLLDETLFERARAPVIARRIGDLQGWP